MKKHKKIISLVMTCCLCSFLFVGAVSAVTQYTSSLSVDGATLKGATRYFSAGNNTIDVKPTKLVPQEASEYVKLRVSLYKEDSKGKGSLIDYDDNDMYKVSLGYTWVWEYGRQSSGNYYYFFATKIDGHDYGYVYAPKGNVLMQTR